MFRIAGKALFAVLLAGGAAPAIAADDYEPPVEVPEVVGGWYIRGYIGMSNQFFDGLESELCSPRALLFRLADEGGFSWSRSSAAAWATSSMTIFAAI